jgi:hypothetical protein
MIVSEQLASLGNRRQSAIMRAMASLLGRPACSTPDPEADARLGRTVLGTP